MVHLRMLELAVQNHFHFDSAQMPLNLLDAHFRSFEKNVVPKLVQQKIAVLGMKPLAEGEIPRSGVATATECLHYALSLPTTVVINGCETMERLEQALEAARTFKPLSGTQMAALRTKTREVAMTGRLEKFKTSNIFDGTAKNPQWMG
jgi:aryl-alcohol dehydrogenase-like predicted oxidoreductase